MSEKPIEIQDKNVSKFVKHNEGPSFMAVIAESLFVLLPLVVLTIVLLQKGKGIREILSSPEWSFAGAVLLGQTVIKLVYATAAVKRDIILKPELMQLTTAIIIVLGLVPSLIILALIMTTEEPSIGTICAQIILFIIGLIVFLLFGTVAHTMVTDGLSIASKK